MASAVLLRVAAAGLALLLSGVALAGEVLDRRYVPIPPAYPAPPRGFVPLPSSGAPLILRDPDTPSGRPIWHHGRAEVVIGLDARGRITHVLEYTSGRFDR